MAMMVGRADRTLGRLSIQVLGYGAWHPNWSDDAPPSFSRLRGPREE